MDVTVRARHLDLTEPLRGYAERRTRVAAHRFEHRIDDLDVCIADVNGPRGGVDKTCVIMASFKTGGSVLVRAADADAYSAVDRAAARIRTVLVRHLGGRTALRRAGRRLPR